MFDLMKEKLLKFSVLKLINDWRVNIFTQRSKFTVVFDNDCVEIFYQTPIKDVYF